MSGPTPPTYKTRNWPAYNEAFKRRGSLTIWFYSAMTQEAAPTDKRGRQRDYRDTTIQPCPTMKVLFDMSLRQTIGFVENLLRLIVLDWEVLDFSTLSRRRKTLKFNIPYRRSDRSPHLLVDSTGIKVDGEGEWNARKHGGAKRRVWRKIHIGIDKETLETRAAEFTTSDVGDAPMLPDLLDQIQPEQDISSVTADGAFDMRSTRMDCKFYRESAEPRQYGRACLRGPRRRAEMACTPAGRSPNLLSASGFAWRAA